MKIDVEGYEIEVLRGLESVFDAGFRPAVIVEVTPSWSAGDAASYLTEFCARYGLRPYRLVNEGFFSGRAESTRAPLEIESISSEQQELLLVPVGPKAE